MQKLACLLLCSALALSACGTLSHKKKKPPAPENKKEQAKPAEESAEVDFQGFLGRLRKAVSAHDVDAVAGMMTSDFAFVLGKTADADRKGEGVFQYWDENGLWPELDGILSETFVKKSDYMVAPPQFANPAIEYQGYRAGIIRVNGSWKFAYFING
ncbi:MAG: hypothetical protein ACR2HH_10520 [Chthoniobacterales bacterium]